MPEDKFNLVKTYQSAGHTVGMCGDGANDAPALRQAQIGIAVSTATDVAKSAAGMVLTDARPCRRCLGGQARADYLSTDTHIYAELHHEEDRSSPVHRGRVAHDGPCDS